MEDWRLSRVGDAAITIEFELRIDPAINARVLAVADALRRSDHGGVRDVVESYCAVTVEYNPLRTDVQRVIRDLEAAAGRERGSEADGREHTVPVCYGGDFGPDLATVAAFAGCSEALVIETHGAAVYRVYMLGFLPGFAYMDPVDERIAMPRRETPRLRVPARSVGIAGRQTGVYPVRAPGGWQLIGRTPVRPFDLEREQPFLLGPGDRVRFEAISESEYRLLSREA